MEEWRVVGGYPDYIVSNAGRIISIRNKKILNGCIGNHGYRNVHFNVNGVSSKKTVHRLVAATFLGAGKPREVINHIDGNKTNNSVSNLEWCTSGHNQKHAYANGLKIANFGEKNGLSKFTSSQVLDIKERLASGEIVADIARKFSVSWTAIYYIKQGATWKNLCPP